MLPLSIAIGVFLMPRFGLGIVFLAAGIALIPSGILAFLDDLKIDKLDRDTHSLIRALGNVMSSLHSTIAVALDKLDRRSMGVMEPYVKRLQTRLNSQLNPDICWDRFRDETGSELVNRTSRMFVDSINLGGDPDKVGDIASDYAMSIALLRDRRNMTSSSFAFIIVPLHGSMVALLVLILEVIKGFNAQLTGMMTDLADGGLFSANFSAIPGLPFFQAKDLTLISYMFQVVIISVTLIDTVAPRFATGGHPIKTAFYGSAMCVITGIAMLVIPPLAGKIFT
jgi:flagellar protein FlaJ